MLYQNFQKNSFLTCEGECLRSLMCIYISDSADRAGQAWRSVPCLPALWSDHTSLKVGVVGGAGKLSYYLMDGSNYGW